MIKTILFVISIIAMLGLAAWGIVKIVNYVNKHSDYDLNASIRQIENDCRRNINSVRNSNIPDAEKTRRIRDLENQMKSDIRDVKSQYRRHTKGTSTLVVCALALASIGFVATVPGSFHQVEAGSVAVVKHLGQIVDVRTPGTYFDFYMTNAYETYDSTVQQVEINTASYSKDGQTMDLEIYLQYQIQLDKLIVRDANGKIIQSEGIAGRYVTLSSLQSRIETQCIEKTKAVMSSAEAMTIIQNRAIYSDLVSETVREAIGPDYYVNVQDVVLTNIDFTDEFEKAIEDKVVAEQEKQAAITRAETELEVAKKEAEKKIVEAQGDAEAQKIAAAAAAEAATYKIIETAKAVGYTVDETYNHSITTTITNGGNITSTTDAVTNDIKSTSSSVTIDDSTGIKTEVTDTLLGTNYHIDMTSGPGATSTDIAKTFKELVLDYIEYLAYLETWNGELPQIVSGSDALSILVPTK